MSTRSRIGILNEDGSIESVYCHWDGHLSNNGVTLRDHYQTETDIRELFEFGNMSCLGNTTEDCEFYARDRDEDIADNLPMLHIGEALYLDDAEEYMYLFKSDRWYWTLGRTKNF